MEDAFGWGVAISLSAIGLRGGTGDWMPSGSTCGAKFRPVVPSPRRPANLTLPRAIAASAAYIPAPSTVVLRDG